jgi:hypothetical protein
LPDEIIGAISFSSMAAPKNNQFWKARAKHGADKILSSPQELWTAAEEYFEWCDNNPWYKKEAIKSGDMCGDLIDVPIARPYTLKGLCLFLNIEEQTLNNYAQKAGYEDFFGVVANIKATCYTQKFEGAAVGAYNANIIARDLGLKEHTEATGKDGQPLFPSVVVNAPVGTNVSLPSNTDGEE